MVFRRKAGTSRADIFERWCIEVHVGINNEAEQKVMKRRGKVFFFCNSYLVVVQAVSGTDTLLLQDVGS